MECLKLDYTIQKDWLWNKIVEETEAVEHRIPELPADVAKRFEESRDAEYEKLVQRLKAEATLPYLL